MIKKPEILSPAGDLQKLKYAVVYGADAVYMAGNAFGMRAAAGNFDYNEFKDGISFAHDRGSKVYITVNTMPHSSEIPKLPEYLEMLSDLKVDAIIVADVGVIRLAQKYAPKIPLHISTQTSILNYEAANFWADLGAERIVLARELNLDEIAVIRAKTPKSLEIEAFVHGAMCISYSGRCLISNYLTGRDANRGACAQPCRWKYSLVEETRPGQYFPVVEDDGGTYLYNSKDMCMIEHIPDLVKAGVDSFKIEGRAKTAYYTAGITNAYKQAVNAYFENPSDSFVLPSNILEEIYKVSHRNYYTGFFYNEPNGQHYDDSHYIRDWDITAMLVSKDREGNAEFELKNRFYKGDELELMQPGKPPYRFKADIILNEKGEEIDVARHPRMKIRLKFPFEVDTYGILRREKEVND